MPIQSDYDSITRKEFLEVSGLLTATAAGGLAGCVGDGNNLETGSTQTDDMGTSNSDTGIDAQNVILIMADDAGEEMFEPYADSEFETPNIGALAEEGQTFSEAYSTPLCTPTRNEIMTGRSNKRNYVQWNCLSPDETTFGNMFQDAGYRTACAGKWQLYENEGTHPEEAGFDEWCLWRVNERDNFDTRYWSPILNVNGEVRDFGEDVYGPRKCVDFLTDFITQGGDEPFFAYYPTILPHGPFVPPPGGDDGSKFENYKQMTNYLDSLVGEIVETLEATGIREETLIVFTSDNGTPSGFTYTVNGEDHQGSKADTTEASMNVPLIASMPGTVPEGDDLDDLVGLVDILPTLADFTGVSPPDVTIDGQSFAAQLRGETGTSREWLYNFYYPWAEHPELGAEFAWDREWKLYQNGELYNYANDLTETNPVTEETEAATAAREKLRGALDAQPKEPQKLSPELMSIWRRDTTEGDGTEPVPGRNGIPDGRKKFASTEATFTTEGDLFRIRAKGDTWDASDQYGTIYEPDAISGSGEAIVQLRKRTDFEEVQWSKAGLMIKNDITKAETADQGYATVLMTNHPRPYVMFDSDGDGLMDHGHELEGNFSFPQWLKLSKNGTTITGHVGSSQNDWQEIASVEMPDAQETQDVGVFVALKSDYQTGYVEFSDFSIKE